MEESLNPLLTSPYIVAVLNWECSPPDVRERGKSKLPLAFLFVDACVV